MFQMKRFLSQKDTMQKDETEEIEPRVKKASRMKKKSKQSPDKMINYKQTFRQRLTVKRGIFPHAIQTNILSRHGLPRQSPKMSPHRDKYNSRPENAFFDMFNRKLQEDNAANVPVVRSPSKNRKQKLSELSNYQSQMSLDAASAHQKNTASLDLRDYCDSDENINTPVSQSTYKEQAKETQCSEKPTIQFTYYRPQDAQQILLYRELAQIINKTMIIERVKHFGNFPDIFQEVNDKLWEIRSAQDEEFDSNSNFGRHDEFRASKQFDECSDDELKIDQYSQSLDCSMKSVEMRKKSESSPFVFKLPDNFDEKKINKHPHHDMEFEDRDAKKFIHQYRRRDNRREMKQRDTIFNSTLISTNKLDQNLTLNPIEFLENLSKPCNKKDDKIIFQFEDDSKNVKSPECDASMRYNNRRPVPNYESTDLLNEWGHNKDTERESFQEDCDQYYRRKPVLVGCNFNAHKKILKKQSSNCVCQETSLELNPGNKRKGDFQGVEFSFPSMKHSQTPEMKYYPCRLY